MDTAKEARKMMAKIFGKQNRASHKKCMKAYKRNRKIRTDKDNNEIG